MLSMEDDALLSDDFEGDRSPASDRTFDVKSHLRAWLAKPFEERRRFAAHLSDDQFAEKIARAERILATDFLALAAENEAEHAFCERLDRAWDNPKRGLPVPIHMRRSVWGHPEYAEEALRLAKQKRAKAACRKYGERRSRISARAPSPGVIRRDSIAGSAPDPALSAAYPSLLVA